MCKMSPLKDLDVLRDCSHALTGIYKSKCCGVVHTRSTHGDTIQLNDVVIVLETGKSGPASHVTSPVPGQVFPLGRHNAVTSL
jgi:glycine cleavage system H lipoate-binding protein